MNNFSAKLMSIPLGKFSIFPKIYGDICVIKPHKGFNWSPWLGNISVNFRKNLKLPYCYFKGFGGRWLMKNTWSKNSRYIVPLNMPDSPSTPIRGPVPRVLFLFWENLKKAKQLLLVKLAVTAQLYSILAYDLFISVQKYKFQA